MKSNHIMSYKLLFKIIPKKFLSQQARKPSGIIGRYLIAKMFTTGNADLNAFTKENLSVEKTDRILEIGFGPGKMIAEIAELTTAGVVEGIDFSATMFKQASEHNRQFIESGRVRLQLGDCRQLPFADNYFDKICSVNTLYFWQNPEPYFAEILRVLKPQGKIVIGFRDAEQMKRLDFSEEIFRTYSKPELAKLLVKSGFNNVKTAEKNGKPFVSYCAIAKKAS